jgi:hypothetical protein
LHFAEVSYETPKTIDEATIFLDGYLVKMESALVFILLTLLTQYEEQFIVEPGYVDA